MLEKIKEILEDILDEELDINLDTKFEELEDWDSVSFMTFVVSLENEFKTNIDVETIRKCETIEALIKIMRDM